MEFYLRWLDAHERRESEEAPIGLILTPKASREQVEMLQMHQTGIAVAEFWTVLPPKHELERKLAQIVRDARERLARRGITAAFGVRENEEDDE
jgi:hypothetical protein